MASPKIKAIVVLDVGASSRGQASFKTGVIKTTSDSFASLESTLAVIETNFAPIFLIVGIRFSNSSLSPDLPMAMIMSSHEMIPASPWAASAGCKKTEGVPVEDKVEEIFFPTSPDLPTPVTINFPLHSKISSIACLIDGSKFF